MAGGVEGEEGSWSDAGGGGEAEMRELGDGARGGGFALGGRKAGDVGGADAGSGVFDRGRKRKTGGEEGGAGVGFGVGLRGANDERGAACDGLRSGHAELDAGGAGGGVERKDDGFLARSGEERGGFLCDVRLEPNDGVKRKIGDVEDGEHLFEPRMDTNSSEGRAPINRWRIGDAGVAA